MPKKFWWAQVCSPFVNVHRIRHCLHGVKRGKGKPCTLICAMLLEVSSKFWNRYAIMLAGGGPVKAATQMRKLNPDLPASLLQVVEMVVVAPSPSWHPSCLELLCSARASPSVAPCLWSLTSQNPHVPCHQWCPACELGWMTACRCSVTHSRPQTANASAVSFYSEFLLFCGEAGFFGSTVPSVTWAGVGKLQVVGPPKLALEKVHQAQLWGGWRVARGVPLLRGCDITQF